MHQLSKVGLGVSISSSLTPVVTIGMPIYNAGHDLSLSVLSIINQSFKSWELLLIDDGSIDNSLQSLSWVFDPRVNIIKYTENKGLAFRLNEALSMARGEYFARMDQDDVAHPDRLLFQLEFLKKNSRINLVGSQYVIIDQHNICIAETTGKSSHSDIICRPWHEIRIAHPTWFGKTSWFREYGYKYPASFLSEDQELLLRAKDTSQYFVMPDYLLAYRVGRVVQFNKKFKTRLSLLKVHITHFYMKKERLNLIMSFLVFFACLFKDVGDSVFQLSFYLKKFRRAYKISDENGFFWGDLIKSYLEEITTLEAKVGFDLKQLSNE